MATPESRYVAVVTGRNRGIGLECVRRLCENLTENDVVILCSRNEEHGEEAKKDILQNNNLTVELTVKTLDISDENSITALCEGLKNDYGEINLIINNAALAFPMVSDVPFSKQARETVDVNYYGTKNMCLQFSSILSENGRVVNIASFAGESALSSMSENVRNEFLSEDLTLEKLDQLCETFVSLAQEGKHVESGYPGTSYGFSKSAVICMARILSTEDHPMLSVCPGFCRTGMTNRGSWTNPVDWVFWAAGYIAGHSANKGAEVPVWLGQELSHAEVQNYVGKLINTKE